MPVRFRCSACSRTLSTASRKTGSFISCPLCRNAVLVEPLTKVASAARSTHNAASPDFSMFELDPLPDLRPRRVKKSPAHEPRVFAEDRLHTAARPTSNVGVRLIAWAAAVLLLVAIGAFLYFGFGPKA